MTMPRKKKFIGISMLIVGAILSWGGILYGISDPNELKVVGVVAMLIGYGVFLWGAVIAYD